MNDKLLLSPYLVPFFFNDILYIIEEPSPEKPKIVEEKKFNKTFVIFLNKNEFNNDEILKSLLEKILLSVKVTLGEVEICDTSEANIKLMTENNITHSLIFGSETIKTEKYIIEKGNGLTYILADSLNKINSDVSLKKQLWTGLKQMFNQ